MADNPVEVTDIEARWRSLSATETSVAEAMIDDMWARAQALIPTLSTNMDSGVVSSELARAVLAGAVIRVLRNPEGLRQQQIDDYSYTRDSALSSGGLYLSDEEMKLLAGSTSRARSMVLGSRFGDSSWL
jgi:hypothetical protein